ncbi:MAG: alanine racemase [Gaiellales bacterium]|nr:MAG: alanine racemase [Gaiellales bacterium]
MPRALATVDLECVRHNVGSLRQRLAPPSSLMAVVKADGYGHGDIEVARAALEAGAVSLGVATAGEAVRLRTAGFDCPVLVMGALTGAEAAAALDAGAEIILWTGSFLRSLIDTVRSRDLEPARVHIKLDTGMRRLGVYPSRLTELLDLVETSPEVELAGLMTHFATADEDDDDFFQFQLRTFEDAAQTLLAAGVSVPLHAANSAAAIRFPESHFDFVRCGIAIYGLSPFQGDAAADGLRPALRLSSYLADVKQLREGDTVGYGRTFMARRETSIGIVPVGYGDGYNRLLSNRGEVLAGGSRFPVVGRISMDQITIDLGPMPAVEPGDEVVLIGRQGEEEVSAEEVASLLDTINYEVTCNISARVERRYEG